MKSPSRVSMRPTEERVRDAILNILRFEVGNAVVIDFFAGTGALGLEALSRGASFAVFVENNKEVLEVLSENIAHLKYESKTRIISKDVFRAAEILVKEKFKADLIFIDPPYHSPEADKAMASSYWAQLLSKEGVVALEISSKLRQYSSPPELVLKDKRKWGNTAYLFFTGETETEKNHRELEKG